MRDVLGPGTMLGYCTNVHAGATYSESIDSLRQYSMAVKQRVSPTGPMGVGWWLSREGVRGLDRKGFEGFPWLKSWFAHHGLVPFTCNGFPYGNFHGPIVKHHVYEPAWNSDDRLSYTIALATMLAKLSDAGDERSISTLPIGWPNPPCEVVDQRAAATNLVKLAEELRRLERSSGVTVHVDLEPEPGCILQRSGDVVLFFKQHLLPAARERGTNDATIFRHIRVCHDICHAAVMFEDQAEMFAKYKKAGIKIGKVQISNAVRVDFESIPVRDRSEALHQLRAFAEDRYLHQTMIRFGEEGEETFFADLPTALDFAKSNDNVGKEWRVHFHVPLFVERFGLLETTQSHILDCLRLLKGPGGQGVNHWEVETYAWNVLPQQLQAGDLAEGIAREMQWVIDRASETKP